MMDNVKNEKVIELAQTFLLSAVVLFTAWCGYQSGRWGGVQTFKLSESHALTVLAVKKTLIAESRRTTDIVLASNFVNAVVEKNQPLIDYYISNLDTELGRLLKAWLDTNPLENENAPPHPLAMPHYIDNISRGYLKEVENLFEREQLLLEEAQEAKRISSNYTFKTVLLSAVLFLGGILSKMDWLKLKICLLVVAYCIALVTSAQLMLMGF